MVVMATCARECSEADETSAQYRTDRTAECLRRDQGSGQKADRGADARSQGGRARNPATCTGDSSATGSTQQPADDATDEQSSLAAGVPDDGAENATEATEKTRDEKQQKSMSHGSTNVVRRMKFCCEPIQRSVRAAATVYGPLVSSNAR